MNNENINYDLSCEKMEHTYLRNALLNFFRPLLFPTDMILRAIKTCNVSVEDFIYS